LDVQSNQSPEGGWQGGTAVVNDYFYKKVPGQFKMAPGGEVVIGVRRGSEIEAGSILADTMILNGTFTVKLVAGVFVEGDAFRVFQAPAIAGAFTTVNLPSLSSALEWDASQLLVSGMLRVKARLPLPGDLTGDFNVDAADLSLMTEKIRQRSTDLKYDINGDGKVTVADARKLALMISR
jgi:hypothetical protein